MPNAIFWVIVIVDKIPPSKIVYVTVAIIIDAIIALISSALIGPILPRIKPVIFLDIGVIVLNSARGELVDEDALVAALESGRVSGAWFDAFWEEPYTGPLTRFDQVLLTPHVGTYTQQCRLSMESAAVHNLLRDLGCGRT